MLGRVWFAISALLMYGVYKIDKNRLHYHINDFPTLGFEEAVSFVLPAHDPRLDPLVYYFLFTGVCAVGAAATRDIPSHRTWVCRHIAGGLWVAIQRLLIACMHSIGRGIGSDMMDLRVQKKIFGDCTYLGVVFAVAIAEVAAADLGSSSTVYPPPSHLTLEPGRNKDKDL